MLWIIALLIIVSVALFVMRINNRKQKMAISTRREPKLKQEKEEEKIILEPKPEKKPIDNIIALRLIAEKDNSYNGYELLQALLANGFRFGKMDIFHRHENMHGQGKVLFSLASVSEPGTFDVHNMGGISCEGLTIFMRFTDHEEPSKILDTMLETSRALADDLGGELWDDKNLPLDKSSIERWQAKIDQFIAGKYSYDLFEANGKCKKL